MCNGNVYFLLIARDLMLHENKNTKRNDISRLK